MVRAGRELPARQDHRVPAVTVPGAAGTRGPGAARVIVTVGTDQHPFDRLITWVNDWLGQHPEQAGEFFVQSGTALVAPRCPAERFLNTDQLDALLDGARVMICHGGPASIANAWMRGQVPIVVPRLRRLGEHVDDHQLLFCVTVAELGHVRLAETPTALADLLDEAARDSRGFRSSGPEADVDAAVARFGALVDELIGRPRRRLQLFHRDRRTRRVPATDAGTPADVSDLPPGPVPAANTNWPASSSSAHADRAGMANEEQG
jgi:UDP-N-acetylglucosamine transferase subunit ALG13